MPQCLCSCDIKELKNLLVASFLTANSARSYGSTKLDNFEKKLKI